MKFFIKILFSLQIAIASTEIFFGLWYGRVLIIIKEVEAYGIIKPEADELRKLEYIFIELRHYCSFVALFGFCHLAATILFFIFAIRAHQANKSEPTSQPKQVKDPRVKRQPR
jgi:hypothetical protein